MKNRTKNEKNVGQNVSPATKRGFSFTEKTLKRLVLISFAAVWLLLAFFESVQLYRINELSLFLPTEQFFKEMMTAPAGEQVRRFYETPMDVEPGIFFRYMSGNTAMLAQILRRVTGEPDLVKYLDSRLFSISSLERANASYLTSSSSERKCCICTCSCWKA